MEEKVKLIAFYLPQFHECEENNLWWGKGFTEWTNTRNAKAIYSRHNQPREPFDDKYYDLLNEKDIAWQMKLAKDNNIYGFCLYHYWFHGKKLLYKPLDIIRNMNKDDKIPYCFCWANESWTRVWEGSSTLLIEQTYGEKDEWEEHFQYLLPFFCDKHYMKHDNAPILVLYRSQMIPKIDEMVEYWNMRCKEVGFSGIFLIDEYNSFQKESKCAHSLMFEPMYTMKYGRTEREFSFFVLMSRVFNHFYKSNNLIYSYSLLWKNILRREYENTIYLGAFVDWDNVARKGKNGRIVLGASPKKFEKNLRLLKDKAAKNCSEYIFINAWNEWGEGTYLEPDKKNGFKYLDAVRKIFT